ncbi:hypothetical protein JS531_08195 [Bifidobacterium sp. CP2]|nr:hypothetical protein [Bifidobacterium sp. CP2]MBT1181930.1 hypothetical protein [Bifidobacterium sp. CP2]
MDRLRQNLGGTAVTFTPDELADIDRTLDSITIKGARYQPTQEALTNH